MKPNPDLSPRSREEIIRQLEQFSIEVLQAALLLLRLGDRQSQAHSLDKKTT